MERFLVRLLISFIVILTVVSATQTVKAADKLPLKRGTYVEENALHNLKNQDILPSAATIYYDGKGLNTEHVKSTITRVRKTDNVYFISEQLKSLEGDSGGKSYSSRCTITINSRTSFSISDIKINDEPPDQKISTYHWFQD
jgi:hypothetical protein